MSEITKQNNELNESILNEKLIPNSLNQGIEKLSLFAFLGDKNK